MKNKKKLLNFVVILCFFISTLFVMTACDEKQNIEAPTLNSISQDIDGMVYISYSPLQHKEYGPEFSFDGETWCLSQSYDNNSNSAQILSYDSQNELFYCYEKSGQKKTLTPGTTITISMRECETATTNASEKSNTKEIKLKKRQLAPDYYIGEGLVGTIERNNFSLSENQQDEEKRCICYNDSLNKFVFAKHFYSDVTPVGEGDYYNFVEHFDMDNTIWNNIEYCLIDMSNYQNISQRDNEINCDAFKDKVLTFLPCNTGNGFTVADNYFYQKDSSQYFALAIRFKESEIESKLPSRCVLIEMRKYEPNYFISYDNTKIAEYGFSINYSYLGNNHQFSLQLNDSSQVATMQELKSSLTLNKSSNYSNAMLSKTVAFTLELSNENADIDNSNNNDEYSMVFKVNGETVITASLIISINNPL